LSNNDIIKQSLAVDAACSGNPGDMEYRGVWVESGDEILESVLIKWELIILVNFSFGTWSCFIEAEKLDCPIYTDSVNAMSWVKKNKCKTKLEKSEVNKPIFDLIWRAEKWLSNNTYSTKIIKWETKQWGEIPADFGRK